MRLWEMTKTHLLYDGTDPEVVEMMEVDKVNFASYIQSALNSILAQHETK